MAPIKQPDLVQAILEGDLNRANTLLETGTNPNIEYRGSIEPILLGLSDTEIALFRNPLGILLCLISSQIDSVKILRKLIYHGAKLNITFTYNKQGPDYTTENYYADGITSNLIFDHTTTEKKAIIYLALAEDALKNNTLYTAQEYLEKSHNEDPVTFNEYVQQLRNNDESVRQLDNEQIDKMKQLFLTLPEIIQEQGNYHPNL